MKLIHNDGVIDFNTILRNVGSIEFVVEDYSKVSRLIYPYITDDNCIMLKLRTINQSFLKYAQYCTVYKTYSEEDAVRMKENILAEYAKGTIELRIYDYKCQEEGKL